MLLALLLLAAVPDKVVDRFTPAPLDQQRIHGYLAERMRVNLTGRLLHIEEDELLAGFRKRPGNHPWIGEHIGKYLDAAANTWEFTHDERLKEQMTRMAVELIKTQGADGYLGTYVDAERWTSWDVWSHKYNLIGLLAYYRISGDQRALNAARKIGDLLHSTFGEGRKDIIAASTHVGMAATSVLEPICLLYRHTGEQRYLDFALYITRAWEQPHGPKLISSLLSTRSVYKTANAKAYEMMSDLVGLLELYRITGRQDFFEVARIAQDDIVRNRRYLTGTTSAHEHFQDDGVLPGEMAHDVGEGCATVTWLQLNLQLLRLTGEARYAQELERTIFNQLLAAQDTANGNICYFTAVNGRKVPTTGINCCRSSEPRGISLIPSLVWGSLPGGIVIQQYTPGETTIGDVQLRMQTDFPQTGAVRLVITPKQAGAFTLSLRIPQWTAKYTATAGGRQYSGKPGEYLQITRRWDKDDQVTIAMDMTLLTLDGGRSYPNSVAFQRGPQVLALEKSRNPEIPYLFRAGVKGADLNHGVVFDGSKLKELPLSFVPFAEATEYRIWIAKPGQVSTQPVPVTIGCRESTSARDKQNLGSLCDERGDDSISVKGNAEVWWAAELPRPASIGRVVVTQGEITSEGGWLSIEGGKPRIQVQRVPKGPWETVGELETYPAPSQLKRGQSFELQLKAPVQAVALRVIGRAGGKFAALAELDAFQ